MKKLTRSNSSFSMKSFCGYCNLPISLNVFSTCMEDDDFGCYYIGQCPICGKPIIHCNNDNSVLPAARGFDNIKHLPQKIETLYNEMRDAFSVKSYTCCVITGRTLLANIAVEQGADVGKSFVEYVDYLVTNYLPKSSPWVDKIRTLGNDSAHKLVIAQKEDAELSLKFLVAILKNIYEFPNSV